MLMLNIAMAMATLTSAYSFPPGFNIGQVSTADKGILVSLVPRPRCEH